ncbi:MAG TPA: adenylate/guanylate cyclase domain-containing protein [Planctomycetota bacterium]|nr:adenylate/guanylate cyclase domain-containing protein [Planctomycetota bacterium]
MPPRKERSKLVSALTAGGIAAVVVLLLQAAGLLRPLEYKAYDFRMRWTLPPERDPKAEPTFVRDDIVILNLSEESLEQMKDRGMGWPWDRREFAKLFRACSLEDFPATSVCFDFFTLGDLDAYKGEPAVIEAAKGPTPIYLAIPFRKDAVPRADTRSDLGKLLEKHAIEVRSDGSVDVPEKDCKSVILPVPGIAEAVAGLCDVETPEKTDGITRRYQVFSKFRGRYYPSFALASLMAREKARAVEVKDGVVTVGKVSFPVDREGKILLKFYRQGESFRQLLAHLVLPGLETFEKSGKVTTFDPSLVADRFVFIGTNAAALYDLKVTPVAETMAGVETHAIALANLLNGETLRPVQGALPLVVIGALALLTAVVTRFTGPAAGGGAAVVLFLGTFAAGTALFKARWAMDLVAPLAAIGLSYAVTSAVNFLYEGRQRQRIKRDFQKYMSPKVVEKILKNPDALSVAGERKMLTIFFMDFAGFTAMSEKVEAAEMVKLISEYHNEAAEEIFRTDGTVDKYIGDAIMAFWNDPIAQEDHALRACLSAVGAQKRLREMAVKMKERGLPEMRARIGINTGMGVVGNMGAKNQVNYTVMGDEVNLASRIEGVNKEFGTDVIVSEATYLPAKGHLEVREVALIKVKGKKVPVRIYELLGLKGEVPAERLEAARKFEQGLAELRARRFQAAWEIFLGLSQRKDRAAETYLKVCEEYIHEPPPSDWDGSYQMETK